MYTPKLAETAYEIVGSLRAAVSEALGPAIIGVFGFEQFQNCNITHSSLKRFNEIMEFIFTIKSTFFSCTYLSLKLYQSHSITAYILV